MCLPSWPTSFIYLKWIVFCCYCVVAKSCLTLWLFMIPRTAAHQAPLSSTVSWSLLKFTSTESVMHLNISSSATLFSNCLQSFPASGSFPMSQIFPSAGQSIGASASASVFPMNIQDWFPLGWTGLISLLSKGLIRVFSNTTVQPSILLHSAFFTVQLSDPYMTTGNYLATKRSEVKKKKEENASTWSYMDKPCKYYAKWKKRVTVDHSLCDYNRTKCWRQATL